MTSLNFFFSALYTESDFDSFKRVKSSSRKEGIVCLLIKLLKDENDLFCLRQFLQFLAYSRGWFDSINYSCLYLRCLSSTEQIDGDYNRFGKKNGEPTSFISNSIARVCYSIFSLLNFATWRTDCIEVSARWTKASMNVKHCAKCLMLQLIICPVHLWRPFQLGCESNSAIISSQSVVCVVAAGKNAFNSAHSAA